MYPFRPTIISLMLLSISLVTGCSGNRAPTAPDDVWRTGETFLDSWTLFTDSNPEITYGEIDLATLMDGYKTGWSLGHIGFAATINEKHWCIAVSVKHDNASDQDQLVYAWLDDDDSANGGPAAASGVIHDGAGEYWIRSPKVTAIHLYYIDPDHPEKSLIVVWVACMVKDKDYPQLGWYIGTLGFAWFQSDFPSTPSLSQTEFEFHGELQGLGNWSPDIAFNYMNSDLHLVWTMWTDLGPAFPKLAYRRCDAADGWKWNSSRIIYEAGKVVEQWIPRVAVGDAGLAEPYDFVVAVVYTERQLGLVWSPYRVGGVYWNPYETSAPNRFLHLPYPPCSGLPAGLPRIAITPDPWCETPYGSISFTQSLADGSYQAMEINNIRNATQYWQYFWPIQNGLNTYGIFPAVACHNTDGAPMASIAYYELASTGQWRVTYGRFDPTLLDPDPAWQSMTGTGASVGGVLSSMDYADYLQIDTFRGSDITAIDSSPWDQAFWVGWFDYIDGDATEAYAAFGDAT